MDYTMAMNYIEEKGKLGTVPGLVNVKELLFRLGNPQNKVACLHIAGTNGKGSIFAYVQEALIEAGYNVGRYVSPTIFDYRERFQINKEYISKEKYCELLEKVSLVVEEMVREGGYCPTAFEIETAIAFQYFYDEKVDFALIECGMGGALDATNVIDHPLVSVFASISMDHMQFLGENLVEIAENKAGIIKAGSMCVSYPQKKEVRDVLLKKCDNLNGQILFSQIEKLKIISMGLDESCFIYKDKEYKLKLLGEHQIYNALVAIDVLDKISKEKGLEIPYEVVYKGLYNTNWQGRMTKIRDIPPVYVDGAHNEEAWLALRESVNKYFTNKKIIYIIGVLKDKDYPGMVDILKDTMNYAITITPDTKRALPKENLSELISKEGIPAICANSALEAMEMAIKKADDNSVIMVSGSLSFILDYLRFGEDIKRGQ